MSEMLLNGIAYFIYLVFVGLYTSSFYYFTPFYTIYKNISYQLNNTPILSWQFIDGIIMIIITLIPILFVIISWFVGYLRNNKIKQISQ